MLTESGEANYMLNHTSLFSVVSAKYGCTVATMSLMVTSKVGDSIMHTSYIWTLVKKKKKKKKIDNGPN
jgi:hypothetical protein